MALSIGKKGSYLEQVAFDGFNINLLARGDGTEIMVQKIKKDKLFYVYPGDNESVMEFFYILSGEMLCELAGKKTKLGPNDYFSAQRLEEPVHFTALTDVQFLWFITEPTFYQLSGEILKLKEVVDEVERKDRYTYKHSERVAEYAVKIAKKLMLSKETLESLYIASILHDIGKIKTPEEILIKPDKLTDEEFNIIKRHPLDGANIVKDLYYHNVATIIEQHHERLNGRGYPFALKDEEILLESRIIAVSDTFDAMTEDRSYRKALSAEFALNELKRLSNIQYDQKVVEAFEQILKEEGRI